MKRIFGLDLGTNSIGFAVVSEAEDIHEQSAILRLGVRVNPLSVDETIDFSKGKSITTNADRSKKKSARRNLHRFRLRRDALVRILKSKGFITDQTLLSEQGNRSTFETYRLRARAAEEAITLEQLARVLLMLNKKRGYKSNRKLNNIEEGTAIDGMEVARVLYEQELTPGQFCLEWLESGKNALPDFYRSDLRNELERIWNYQRNYYPTLLTDELKEEISGKATKQIWAILAKSWEWEEQKTIWDEEQAQTKQELCTCHLVGLSRKTKRAEQRIENYRWRAEALKRQLHPEELAVVIQEINRQISQSSGYLGEISDRSKQLYFNRQTVGQYLWSLLQKDPNTSLRNRVFYRQDYLDEFDKIWEIQASYHPELTLELKHEIRDVIIFYQRGLKSKKGLVSLCEFEQSEALIEKDGKMVKKQIGCRVIPRSHPLFQAFKVWQTLNNVELIGKNQQHPSRALTPEEKEMLAQELFVKGELKKAEVLKLLLDKTSGWDLNFQRLDGDKTGSVLFATYSKLIELYGYDAVDFSKPAAEIIQQLEMIFSDLHWNKGLLSIDLNQSDSDIEQQPYFRLWHLLYSFEGDNTPTGNGKLVEKLTALCGMDKEYATELAKVTFEDEYGSLSAKAIKKLLPHLKAGKRYDEACTQAGYRHSKSSLTKEELDAKVLKEHLDILPKNSLRNPVVEKILNQMVHVVNDLIDLYGHPDEIRVELARELKKSAKERADMTASLAKNTKEQELVRQLLQNEFHIQHVTRNDILRYRLYEELKENGHKTLYSNQYIPKELIFSDLIDIEHIIPQARLFDDSFSNKTLEYRDVNIKKGNRTAYDFIADEYGADALEQYKNLCDKLFQSNPAKLRKLKMQEKDIPDGFIERDLRNTQYISRMAFSLLGQVCRRVVATSGSITDRLREDWQLVDVMKELNLPKYEQLGLVESYQDRNGRTIKLIKDWTKRNDHRHHAMDALTVAFTKEAYVQYFNHMNAAYQSDKPEADSIWGIKQKYVKERRILPPMPLQLFRTEAKRHLQCILVSIKAKNKVVTPHVNPAKPYGEIEKAQPTLTPRGQLHLETIYGSRKQYVTKEEKVNASFTAEKIATVCKLAYRMALLDRLADYGGDPKKAFTGKNSLEKNPVYLDAEHRVQLPVKVKTVSLEVGYTIRKTVDKDLKIDKVVDPKIRRLLQERLAIYGGNAKNAFSNLEENPIWLNQAKGIQIKRVTITGISEALALHDKKDKEGKVMLDAQGKRIPVDFVNTGNNHHVAIYQRPKIDKWGAIVCDESGNPVYELEERVVSFFEAVTRVNCHLPIVDRDLNKEEGWQFLFTMKQNEYFVLPDEKTGFDPHEIDLLDPDNYALISPHLFRVQKLSTKYYMFRHHLETSVEENDSLRGITWERIQSTAKLRGIVKVRINHIGQIVDVGEYK